MSRFQVISHSNAGSIELAHLRREVLIVIEACRPDLVTKTRRAHTRNATVSVLVLEHANRRIQELVDSVIDAAEAA